MAAHQISSKQWFYLSDWVHFPISQMICKEFQAASLTLEPILELLFRCCHWGHWEGHSMQFSHRGYKVSITHGRDPSAITCCPTIYWLPHIWQNYDSEPQWVFINAETRLVTKCISWQSRLPRGGWVKGLLAKWIQLSSRMAQISYIYCMNIIQQEAWMKILAVILYR